MIAGEASTWYLYSSEAVKNIEASFDRPLYIVMTRDPVEMFRSLYVHNRRVLNEDLPSLKSAWDAQEERSKGNGIPKTCVEPAFINYKEACSLGTQLERLVDTVDRGRVLHITLDQMKSDPGGTYRKVLDFLKIEDDGREAFPVLNEARSYRSKKIQLLLSWGARFKRALKIKKNFGFAGMNNGGKISIAVDDHLRGKLEEIFQEEKIKIDIYETEARKGR